MTKLLYIGGYGHSGSTLLEYFISGSPAVLACGEVISCLRVRKKKPCTCGRAAKDCPVWGFLYSANRRSIRSHVQLLRALLQRAGDEYFAIVDSSKTAWGCFTNPLRLRRKFGSNFILIHLTREPLGACWSILRKRHRKSLHQGSVTYPLLLRCGWTVLGWSLANLSCELYRLIYPGQYVHIRYEDLAREPGVELQALFTRVLPGVCWCFGGVRGGDNRHQLYGNSVRYLPLTIEDIKEDLKWKTEMPRECARAALFLSFPLRLRYGYR